LIKLNPVFTRHCAHFSHLNDKGVNMDLVYLGVIAGLWGLMVLLVRGFVRLEQAKGARP
jgi:hypothetical protein